MDAEAEPEGVAGGRVVAFSPDTYEGGHSSFPAASAPTPASLTAETFAYRPTPALKDVLEREKPRLRLNISIEGPLTWTNTSHLNHAASKSDEVVTRSAPGGGGLFGAEKILAGVNLNASAPQTYVNRETHLNNRDLRRKANTYIPVSITDIVDIICDFPEHAEIFKDAGEKAAFSAVARNIALICDLQSQMDFRALPISYRPFNPDVMNYQPASGQEISATFEEFKIELGTALATSGFVEFTQEQMDYALSNEGNDGIKIRLPSLETYEYSVFYRGESSTTKIRTHWTRLWSRTIVEPTYDNLLVAFRQLKPTPLDLDGDVVNHEHWYLKVYRAFEQEDVDMAIPGISYVFRLVDWLILFIPLCIGIGTFTYKMVDSHGAISFTDSTQATTSAILVLAPIVAFFGALLRLNSRRAYYQMLLASTLLRKNMTSNDGTLSFLIQSSARQDAIEAILAFFFLWRGLSAPVPIAPHLLDDQVEAFLNNPVVKGEEGPAINFDVVGGLGHLLKWGLISKDVQGEEETVKGLPARQALPILAEWNALKEFNKLSKLATRVFGNTHGGEVAQTARRTLVQKAGGLSEGKGGGLHSSGVFRGPSSATNRSISVAPV